MRLRASRRRRRSLRCPALAPLRSRLGLRCGFAAAPLSTSLVDKLADSCRGIGFHALRDKPCRILDKISPGARGPFRARFRAGRDGDAATLAQRQCGAMAARACVRCPQTLWTNLRTHGREACFTPCASRPAEIWRFFVQAVDIRIRRRFAASPVPVAERYRPEGCRRRRRRLRLVRLSTSAVDKAADTRRGIGFHALRDKACGILDNSSPRAEQIPPAPLFQRGERRKAWCGRERCGGARGGVRGATGTVSAPYPLIVAASQLRLSTSAVDKAADTRRGIGFHALWGKACGILDNSSPRAEQIPLPPFFKGGNSKSRRGRGRCGGARGGVRGATGTVSAPYPLIVAATRLRMSTEAVDKLADTCARIGFHALRDKASGILDKSSPTREAMDIDGPRRRGVGPKPGRDRPR